MVAPNYAAASAKPLNGDVRVELACTPTGWGNGFLYTLSPDVARELAKQLVDAADAAAKPNPSPTTE